MWNRDMSTADDWRKVKHIAKKNGVDTSVFTEEFGRNLEKADEVRSSFIAAKAELIKQLEKVAQIAGNYREVCHELEKRTAVRDQEDAIGRMDGVLLDIIQEYSGADRLRR